MSNRERFGRHRSRTVAGVAVGAVALAAAGVLGGVGLAGNSVTAAQSQYGKLAVCHRTHSKKYPFHTIVVSASAVPAHLRHGDTAGACVTTTTGSTSTTTTTTSTTTGTTTATIASASLAGSPGKSGESHGNGNANGRGQGKGNGK